MLTYIVTAEKLYKRSIIPLALPDPNNIVGTVPKGTVFWGAEVSSDKIPNSSTGSWVQDEQLNYYWGGGIELYPLKSLLSIQLQKATRASNSQLSDLLLPYINETLAQFSINTPARQLCFLSQVGVESAYLRYTEELGPPSYFTKYDHRTDIGNSKAGDGVKYKGRGLIQITGKNNYEAISNYFKSHLQNFNINFINEPEKLGGPSLASSTDEQRRYSSLSAGWYWETHKLNELADEMNFGIELNMVGKDHNCMPGDHNCSLFREITKKINGGTNGLEDRIKNYNNGLAYFKS